MGNVAKTEFAVTFRRLGITGDGRAGQLVKIPRVCISSRQNLPPSERKNGQLGLRFRWPPDIAPNDSLDRGYTPEAIRVDLSDWGDIYIRFGD